MRHERRIIYLSIYLSILITPSLSFASENPEDDDSSRPVVLTASGVEEPLESVSSSIEVITKEDIEERQVKTVDEVLRGISGIKINSAGGVNPWPFVQIRGADSDQTLVLVDGVEINNPYDYMATLGSIQTDSIERIEVLKGSQSALYGSEAIGGVINIITKEGLGKEPETYLSLKGGNYETGIGSLYHVANRRRVSYSIGYSRLDTEGSTLTGPFSGNTLSGMFRYRISDWTWIQFNSFYWDYEKKDGQFCCELDSDFNLRFTLPDKAVYKEYDWVNSIQFVQYPTDWWNYLIKYSRYDFNSSIDVHGDSTFPYPFNVDSENTGNRDIIEVQGNLNTSDADTFTIGLQYRGERLGTSEFSNVNTMGIGPPTEQPSLDSFRDSRAIYAQNLFKKGGLAFTVGARVEDGLGFGNEVIPRTSLAYRFSSTGTRLRGAYGKGIRAPSLRQLFDPLAGNRELRPERSDSYEISIEQPVDRFETELTYFYMSLKDLIDWGRTPGVPQYVNIGSAWTKGVEAEVKVKELLKDIDLELAYTYMETRDEDREEPLSYRPMNYLSVNARYRGVKRLVLALSSEIVGPSFSPYSYIKDTNGEMLPSTNPAYELVNIAASYIIADTLFNKIELEFKINNVLNKEYTEIGAFHPLGRNYLAGVNVKF